MDNKILKLVGTIGIAIFIIFSFSFNPNDIEAPVKRAQEIIQKIQSRPEDYSPKEIFTPAPLTFPTRKETETPLLNDQIIKFTNDYRTKNNIKKLKKNSLLMEAANNKLNDMFEEQYFAHTSPKGEDAGDILNAIGYDYLIVGENLALGYFKDSDDLVDGWMGSPGHRENILNPKYKEIGVAQRKDKFQGKEQYLAVQIFAASLSLCSLPDESLSLQVQEEREDLEELIIRADILQKEIEQGQKEGVNNKEELQEIQEKIKSYNKLITKINQHSKELEDLISSYNLQVNSFNVCIDSF